MAVMNKQDLIAKIANETDQTKASVGRFMDSFEKHITDSLKNGDEVKLSGFLAFDSTIRAARISKNPRTGEDVQVPEKRAPRVRLLSRLRGIFDSQDD